MPKGSDFHKADPKDVFSFLQKTIPFSELNPEILDELSARCAIDFFPKNTLIFEQDRTEVDYLYLISRGGVKLYLTNTDGETLLKDFRGEGGYFGALGIIRDSKANMNVETVEDTFCYLIDKRIFLQLIQSYPRVSQYYLRKFSEDLVDTAYSELLSRKIRPQPHETFYLFTAQVQDVVKRSPEIISVSETVRSAANRMSQLGIGSVLVEDQSGNIAGIITDKDLRTRVIAAGLDYGASVQEIMSAPVRTIPGNSTCFDALLEMMHGQIHHLAVEKRGKVTGIITAHDIMVSQGTSPLYLFREIIAQRKIEGLYSLSKKIPQVVRTLVEEGAKANNITGMITVLNDHILQRLLTLLSEEMGKPPYDFCWITFGSEGRKEQTFKTDQDNALIYDTPPEDWEHVKAAKLYFRRFGNSAIKHLEACGYPMCPGDMMASNPKWRKPFSVWQNYFDRWISAPDPEEVLNATIFFDFRPVFGKLQLGEQLRTHLALQAPSRGIFLMHLAKDCLAGRPPLTFFRNFIVEKDGIHKNRLDLKTRGLVPIVDFARLLSLRHGVTETNTLTRLENLASGNCISKELYVEAREAYEFQMQLRLVHQLRMLESGQPPNNYIDPGELSDIEKQTLKETFAVIGRIQMYIKDEFRVVE